MNNSGIQNGIGVSNGFGAAYTYGSPSGRQEVTKLDVFDGGSIISEGENSDTVGIIQIILNALKVRYDGYDFFPVTFVFDPPTVAAVREFQRVNRLGDSGIVDGRTWNALASEYARLRRME